MAIVGSAHLTAYTSPSDAHSMLCFWEEDHGNYQHLAHLDRLVASLAGRGLPGLQELWGRGLLVHWVYIGIMEKNMETTCYGLLGLL